MTLSLIVAMHGFIPRSDPPVFDVKEVGRSALFNSLDGPVGIVVCEVLELHEHLSLTNRIFFAKLLKFLKNLKGTI